ncbi:peptidase S8/S53 domain-containing protein [Mycena alexandri]|uniref:Peptidase S8/S53 domain-containing protein n=1 Tax=Mycena alexandri TaxID=1745969 RepID=A0AAD6S8V9_9AGAR|nr:peptidase S8/S53 domain-containing protein [Mycena alexandri]
MSHDDFNARYSLHASQVGTHNLDLGGTDVSQEEHESTVQYLVRLKDGTNMTVHFLGLDRLNVDLSSTRSFYTVVHKFKQSFLLGYIVYFNSKHLSKFQNQSDILHLEKDSDIILETVIMQPDAPWGLARINEASPIDTTKEKFNYIYDNAYETGEGVNIYVFDSGLKSEHVQFGGRVKAAYVHRGGTSGDTDGHGTHVAGIIAGATYGVAKNSTLYECKVLPDGETGTVGKLFVSYDQTIPG